MKINRRNFVFASGVTVASQPVRLDRAYRSHPDCTTVSGILHLPPYGVQILLS